MEDLPHDVREYDEREVARATDKPIQLLHNCIHCCFFNLDLDVDLLHFKQVDEEKEQANLVDEVLYEVHVIWYLFIICLH